jgi:hypothetical protein
MLCRFTVTYPTKYKWFRVTLPRQALRGPQAPIRTSEGLGTTLSPQGRARRCSEGNLAPLVAILGKIEPGEEASTARVHHAEGRGAWEPSLGGGWLRNRRGQGSPCAMAFPRETV